MTQNSQRRTAFLIYVYGTCLITSRPAFVIGSENWLRALPQESRAGYAWNLTLSGNFNSSETYQCGFDFLQAAGQNVESVLYPIINVATILTAQAKPASPSVLICKVQPFQHAASVTKLSVWNSIRSSVIPGPGGTADLITFTAGWHSVTAVEGAGSCSRCSSGNANSIACNLASGGGSLQITGFGFDTEASDYACKFICSPDINAECQNGTFVQGPIPSYPTDVFKPTDQILYCSTPSWPYNAHGTAGRTRLFVEKGGVEIPFMMNPNGFCDDFFDFLEGWDYRDLPSQGYATQGSTSLTITGYGFEPGSNNYSCVFYALPNIQGSAAIVLDSTTLICPTPAWNFAPPTDGAQMFIYKQNCYGSRGIQGPCDTSSKVLSNQADSSAIFFFKTAVASVVPTSSNTSPQIVTIMGGGFDTLKSYVIGISDGINSFNVSVPADNVTGYRMVFSLPRWGFVPNSINAVKVFQAGIPLPASSDTPLSFVFHTSWSYYNTSNGSPQGVAAGGDFLTINGEGFVVNSTVGTNTDYSCQFNDRFGNILSSNLVAPISSTQIICITPSWGSRFVAASTTLRLCKGNYVFQNPSPIFTFMPSWYDWSSSGGPASGGIPISISGYGFDVTARYNCKFSFNGVQVVENSEEVLPQTIQTLVCITPPWKFWKEGRTRLQIQQGTALVQQTSQKSNLDAAYEFFPGFSTSSSQIEILSGQIMSFSFFPDTIPTGDVTVNVISSDSNIAVVTSPFLLTTSGGIFENEKVVFVRHIQPGRTTISFLSNGSNYEGRVYSNVIDVICKAKIIVSSSSVVLKRSSTVELEVRLDARPRDNVTIQAISSDTSVVTISPLNVQFIQNISPVTKLFSLTCHGVGSTNVTLRTISSGSDVLFTGLYTFLHIFGAPGFKLSTNTLSMQPNGVAVLSVAPDTATSLKTYISFKFSNSAIVQPLPIEQSLFFPANSTLAKNLTFMSLAPGLSSIVILASSPALLQQISAGCTNMNALQCTNTFVEHGCDFSTYQIQKSNNSLWLSAMQRLSESAGVADCSQYSGCFRAACCSSPDAQQCTKAVFTGGCRLDQFMAPLSEIEDPSSDWGAEPISFSVQNALYRSWITGIDCTPYVPCAWQRCFPGGGNYDTVSSENISVWVKPGFTIVPAVIHLFQGMIASVQIVPQVNFMSLLCTNVSLLGLDGTVLSNEVALITPSLLWFNGSEALNVTVTWISPGRGSLQISSSNGSDTFSNVRQIFENSVFSYPGFEFSLFERLDSVVSLPIRLGRSSIPVPASSTALLFVIPSFQPASPIQVILSSLNNVTAIQPALFSFLQPALYVEDGHARVNLSCVGDDVLQLKTVSIIAANSLYSISSGTGYTAGNLTIDGYSGIGFIASYQVSVQQWGFYCTKDSDGLQRGRNYSYLGRANFSGPINGTNITVENCFRASTPLYRANVGGLQCIYNHTGTEILGCTPVMTFDVVYGRLSTIRFDSTSCIATGITCQISLSGYGGYGFRGYFSTQMSNLTTISIGTGYSCGWACFATITSGSGNHYISGQGMVGHAQTCPKGRGNCSDGFKSAIVVYGNVSKMRSSVLIHRVAAAKIIPSMATLQSGETLSFQIVPLEASSGDVSFFLESNSSRLKLSTFSFTVGGVEDNTKTFTLTHTGGGAEQALITITGVGTGNYDQFFTTFLVSLMPGFVLSNRSVNLQQYPGVLFISIAPDTLPSNETVVDISIKSDFGTDPSRASYGGNILYANASVTLVANKDDAYKVVITHGGVEGFKLKNSVAGTAVVTFYVSNQESNYNDVNTEFSGLLVHVLPGFESNVQDTYKVSVQKEMTFTLRLKLDHPPTSDFNLSLIVSDSSLVAPTPPFRFVAGFQGPVFIPFRHAGRVGQVTVSLISDASQGNYMNVTANNYLTLEMLPGFVFSTEALHLQYQSQTATFTIGLDTKPTADTEVSIKSSDPAVAAVTSSVRFAASDWNLPDNSQQVVSVFWGRSGSVYISFVASSPGGNYDRVSSGNVSVVCFVQLLVSKSNVLVQKGGSSEIFVSTPTKPKIDTVFALVALPPGVVSLGPPFTVLAGTNSTFMLSLTYVRQGSATVRIFGSAPGDEYDGVYYDISVTAMPGFTFSSPTMALYSCAYNPSCTSTFSFSLDQPSMFDVFVQISGSDSSIVMINPTSVTFNGGQRLVAAIITVTYMNPGIDCLSFAATSMGNYDQVFSGGFTVTAIPDLIVNNAVMNLPLGAPPVPIQNLRRDAPVIYIQSGSFTTFTVEPGILPTTQVSVRVVSSIQIIQIMDPLVQFQSNSLVPQTITLQHLATGTTTLTLQSTGGNFEAARGPAIIVKALPYFILSNSDVEISYHGQYNISFSPSIPLVGSVNLSIVFDEPGYASATPTGFAAYSGQPLTFTIQHIKPTISEQRIGLSTYTYVSLVATGESNFNSVIAVVRLTLLPPGFDVSATVIHIQRFKGSSINNPQTMVSSLVDCQSPFSGVQSFCGSSALYLTPNERITNVTRAFIQSSTMLITIISQAYPNDQAVADGQDAASLLVFYPGDDSPEYFELYHRGQVGKSYLSISAGGSGYLSPFPLILAITHGEFLVPIQEFTIQRQSSAVFSIALAYPPDEDTTIVFKSSSADIVTVLPNMMFPKGDTSSKNISVLNINPGTAYISFSGLSSGFAYGGAEAVNAVTVQCLKGFHLSTLLLNVQAAPSDGGIAFITIKPDDPPSGTVRVSIVSSNTNFINVVTSELTFQAQSNSSQTATVRNVMSGSSLNPVQLTFVLETDSGSNYYGVVIPQVQVIALGTFNISSHRILVQKGQTFSVMISPNVPPDEDVLVYVNVSNISVATCTPTVQFFAGKLNAQMLIIDNIAAGFATVSLAASSLQGNYNGATLGNAISVHSLYGFSVFFTQVGFTTNIPASEVGVSDLFVVQKQPTSQLGYIEFLVTTDIIVNIDTSVAILTSDSSVAVPVTTSVTFPKGVKTYNRVTVHHGGTAGLAFISFQTLTADPSNYAGIQSGAVKILAMPGFSFSSNKIDVQKGGIATFTIAPDTLPTGDFTVNMVSSDPSIATVTASVSFRQIYGIGNANTIAVTLRYQQVGTVAISFFASGANYDGVIWSNGVVAACRPGFVLSLGQVSIPFAGTAVFTLQPDTVPTADTLVTVISSQPTKAAATTPSILFKAGQIKAVPITIQSRCSVSPGNCARAGSTEIGFSAQSSGGNYDGVILISGVVASVLSPVLLLSESAIFIQQSAGQASFTVGPSVIPNVDTYIVLEALDASVCTVTASISFSAGNMTNNTRNVTAYFVGVGETSVRISVRGPEASSYSSINPVYVHVRALASFDVSTNNISIQRGSSVMLGITPNIEISSDVMVSVSVSDTAIIAATPSNLIFSPPSVLVGLNVSPQVGMKVVKSANFQVWPRLGVGHIAQILNDNLDVVSVNWTYGPKLQPNSVGYQGQFMLALSTPISQNISVYYVATGKATLSLLTLSSDVNFNGISFEAATAYAEPSLIFDPQALFIQYRSWAICSIMPSLAPTEDTNVVLQVLSTESIPETGQTVATPIANVSPTNVQFSRALGISVGNVHSVNITCMKEGPATLFVRGIGGIYSRMQYSAMNIVCLPGFHFSKVRTAVLSNSLPVDTILVSPLNIPDQQITVVINASNSYLIKFNLRLVFLPFVFHQSQAINVRHAGAFNSGSAFLSLQSYGGNYDKVTLLNVVEIPVQGPLLEVSPPALSIQPGAFAIVYVRLDTVPSATTLIRAVSSDTQAVTVAGPPYPTTDTSKQPFNVSFVRKGNATISFQVYAPQGTTYGNFQTNVTVHVEALGAGFLFSATQIKIQPGSSSILSFGPDSAPDSTVKVYVTAQPSGIVAVTPAFIVFQQGPRGQSGAVTLSWLSPGVAQLVVKSEGGIYQYISEISPVLITTLPNIPGLPQHITVAPVSTLALEVTWQAPALQNLFGLASSYRIEFSTSLTFASLSLAEEILNSSNTTVMTYVTPQFQTKICLFVRIFGRNLAGLGSPAVLPGGCISLLDPLGPVNSLAITSLGAGWIGLNWKAPSSGGTMTFGIEAIAVNGSVVVSSMTSPNVTGTTVEIPVGMPLQLRVWATQGLLSGNPALAYFEYAGSAVRYFVPFRFNIVPQYLEGFAGTTSQILVSPESAPTLDVLVYIASSNPLVAGATDHLIFQAGTSGAQAVVITFLQIGASNLTFSAVGGIYVGLSSLVTVRTRPLPETI